MHDKQEENHIGLPVWSSVESFHCTFFLLEMENAPGFSFPFLLCAELF